MIAIPSIKYGFLLSVGNRSSLMKRRLSMVSFPSGMTVEWLKVNGPPRLSILFGTNDHSVTPSYWLTNGDRF